MRKLIVIFISLVGAVAFFQSCSNTKTYAEKLEEERNAVQAYIKAQKIKEISVEEFEKDTVTDVVANEYVAFPNGVYMQIVRRYNNDSRGGYASLKDAPVFANNNIITVRYTEVDITKNDTTGASNVGNRYDYLNVYPDGFRYTERGLNVYGQFIAEPGLAYNFGMGMAAMYGSTSVPEGWLMVLKYLRDGAHIKLIVPSKSGHPVSAKNVYPYFYDMRNLSIY